jgi:hypothetical protein
MKGIVTGGLSVLMVALLAQSAAVANFTEDFDGSNGAWTHAAGLGSGTPDDNVFGDVIPGKNGWVAHPTLGGVGHRVIKGNVDHPGGPDIDLREGVGRTQGAGNSWEGCNPPGCGSAHPIGNFSVLSVLTRVSGLAISTGTPINGTGQIYLGDALGENGYQVEFASDGTGGLARLQNGSDIQGNPALADDGFSDISWFELQIVINPNGSAFAQYQDVDDDTGIGADVFTHLGDFDGGGVTVELLAIASTVQNQGGASAVPFDNVKAFPEPASLVLLGLGGLMMLRRRR